GVALPTSSRVEQQNQLGRATEQWRSINLNRILPVDAGSQRGLRGGLQVPLHGGPAQAGEAMGTSGLREADARFDGIGDASTHCRLSIE
ncbi:hypothetical protein PMAYCL1PPCAC_27310, partial [Pristionchus mayeri]